ncbi:tRNA pseudouridine synthase, putative [Plasmodium malariae]|uniref:tRNA pseudouridine synthase, putative n=1 Tax=Plasmodium malariae TaxID=5858 RepID=A0A1C3KBC5_PLAMA|nr:tRNA pseudouridine synthase, putative [Plasmodium malariae]
MVHQIRHIVATLFLVGKGKVNKSDIINSYKIADENGLLLYSFKFNDLNFNINVNNRIFSNVMNKYIQNAILLVSLCYPLKISETNENFFQNINDEDEIPS